MTNEVFQAIIDYSSSPMIFFWHSRFKLLAYGNIITQVVKASSACLIQGINIKPRILVVLCFIYKYIFIYEYSYLGCAIMLLLQRIEEVRYYDAT